MAGPGFMPCEFLSIPIISPKYFTILLKATLSIPPIIIWCLKLRLFCVLSLFVCSACLFLCWQMNIIALCVYPYWKAALRNFGWMLPSLPIFPVYNFFRQSIWHSIFDQFHFHHLFGDEMTVSSDQTGKGTSHPPFGSWHVLVLGTSWMAIRGRSFKYLDAQQVS